MGKQVFVGNLDYGVTEDDLRRLFEESGFEVESVSVKKDHETSKPRGFGFVTVPNHADMDCIVERLKGHVLMGRAIGVEPAKGPQPRTATRGM